jgi:ferric-dicitrate binding protein FerR (iron transport regulator)
MNRREPNPATNPEDLLDRVIAGIRDEHVSETQVEEARHRVWEKIVNPKSGRLSSCSDFQALIPAYREGTLTPGRRMLFEDHAHQCVHCRKALFGEPAAPAAVVQMPVRRMTRARWMAIAASAAVALITGRWAYEEFAPAQEGSRATIQMVDGSVYRLQNGMLQPASAGSELASREILRTAANSHATVKLIDGSVVEVGERAEFSVTAQRRDTTVHLNRGPIIVQAAKRRSGHLYVASGDSRVAVTGTLFSVNRGAKGTRVSVMEGEVIVERGHNDSVLHAGDQLATHASMQTVPIKDEIAWSRSASDHIKTLQEMVAIKEKLQDIRTPGVRYQSRLMDLVPTNAVIFLSVPNAKDSIADAQRLFAAQMQRSGAKNDEKINEFLDRLGRFSDYLGDEFVVAGVRNGAKMTAVAIADVHRPGLREFLETERQKTGESKVQIVEGNDAVHARQPEEMLVSIRNDRVVFGVDEALVNGASAGAGGFASTPFGQRISQAFREGTGVILGLDVHSLIEAHADPGNQTIISRLGADSVRYLIAEQKSFRGSTQHTAVLNFDGERHGLASWLGAPGPMGGLGFVSPQAQFAASVITKNPQQMIDELFAFAQSKGPEGIAKLEEIQRLAGVDIRQDIAASLGSELTIALDGPMIPIPSWKAILEVNKPDRLQQTIEKLVAALNTEAQKHGQGVAVTADAVVSGQPKTYTIKATGQAPVTEVHYLYTEGYLIAGPTKELILKSVQSRSSGVRLDTSSTFRRLLPTDQYANFSGLIYQNAQEALKLLSSIAPDQQDAARELAEKIGPTLIGAYANADSIQVTTFGSSMDLLMQTALAPMFHGDHSRLQKKSGTLKQTAAYRKQWRR